MIFLHKTRNILDLNKFNSEARALNPKIEAVLKFGSDDLRFNLAEDLTVNEELEIDSLVSDFEDLDPDDFVPLIYDYTKEEAVKKHFHNIDYKKELNTSLIPVREIVQGEVIKVDWYASLDESMTPVNLVLSVSITYSRDDSGFATSRTVERTWYNRNGDENPEKKITTKYYFINPSDMIAEGLRRRKLLVNEIQIPALTYISEILAPSGLSSEAILFRGRAFMDLYEDLFNKFVDNSSTITDPADINVGRKTIVVKLEDDLADGFNRDHNDWLDAFPASLGGLKSIRSWLIEEFSI